MPNLFYAKIDGELAIFDDHESTHMKVTRIKGKSIIEATDGNGHRLKVVIEKVGKDESFGKILRIEKVVEPKGRLVLFAPSGRWERLRWGIEKAVELGVDEIYVFNNERASRHYDDKQDKLELVVRDACKQCIRYDFPIIRPIEFLEIFSLAPKNTFILDFSGKSFPTRISTNVGIIAGPEGGFTKIELDKLKEAFPTIRLGKKVLRFETAIILSLGFFSYRMKKI